jgi:hypothetical protein
MIKITNIFILLISLVAVTGCFQFGGTEGTLKSRGLRVDREKENPDNKTIVPKESEFFQVAYKKMRDIGCFNCHRPGSSYRDMESLVNEQQWISTGLIKAGSADESFLIKKLRHSGSPVATMPPDNKLSKSDFDLLKTWISHVVEIPDGPLAKSDGDIYKVESNQIGVEQFVGQLKRLYFVKNDPNRELASIAVNWRNFWGGGCDYYSASVNRVESGFFPIWDNPDQVCGDPKQPGGPLGSASVIKEGARIVACEFYNDRGHYLDAFFEKGFVPDRKFTRANAEKAFHLYYPTLDFTDEVFNNFNVQAKAAYPDIEKDELLRWRLFLSTLCQSLYWEVH